MKKSSHHLRAFILAGLASGLLMASAGAVSATSVPVLINFQGKLYDPTGGGGAGAPLTGIQQVEFRIYDSLTGGTLIWGRRFPVFCNSDGVFNVMLNDDGTSLGGTVTSLKDAFAAPARFLELTVQGHGTAIAPRQQIVSAPYAFRAERASYAGAADQGFQVSGGLTVQSGGATVSGALVANNNVTVNGGLVLSGGLTNKSGAVMGGGTKVNDGLTVNGGATIGGNVSFTGGTVTVSGGYLTAQQRADFKAGINVYGQLVAEDQAMVAMQGLDVQGQPLTVFTPLQCYQSIDVSQSGNIGGDLTVWGQLKFVGEGQSLTSGDTLSSDGLLVMLNKGDINVTIGDYNLKKDSLGAVTLPGFKGNKVTWSDCDYGIRFYPFDR